MKKLVNFLICGTQKGGTSALWNYLIKHPKLYLPKKKELRYFNNDKIDWKTTNHEVYHKHFTENNFKEKLCGEATPIYMYWNESAKRIFEYNKNIKIIISLRNPITRSYSHWKFSKKRNIEKRTFYDAISSEVEYIKSDLSSQNKYFSYVDRGFYTQQLNRLNQFFPKDQIIIIRHEDLLFKHQETLTKIFNFIGVESEYNILCEHINVSNDQSCMSKEEKKLLKNIFYDEIKKLEIMLDWDCRSWLEHE